MKNVMMYVMVALIWAGAAGNAMALTLKKGEVIASDGTIAQAHETESAQRKLENDGVFVGGGIVAVQIGDEVVTIPVEELRGKSRDQVVEIIGDAAVMQLEDMHADAEALVAEIEAEGGSAFNAVGSTLQEEVDAILSGNHDAIVGGSQAAADYLVANDPDTVSPEEAKAMGCTECP